MVFIVSNLVRLNGDQYAKYYIFNFLLLNEYGKQFCLFKILNKYFLFRKSSISY